MLWWPSTGNRYSSLLAGQLSNLARLLKIKALLRGEKLSPPGCRDWAACLEGRRENIVLSGKVMAERKTQLISQSRHPIAVGAAPRNLELEGCFLGPRGSVTKAGTAHPWLGVHKTCCPGLPEEDIFWCPPEKAHLRRGKAHPVEEDGARLWLGREEPMVGTCTGKQERPSPSTGVLL